MEKQVCWEASDNQLSRCKRGLSRLRFSVYTPMLSTPQMYTWMYTHMHIPRIPFPDPLNISSTYREWPPSVAFDLLEKVAKLVKVWS